VRCIYVAIGQEGLDHRGARQTLDEAGAMEYTTSSPPRRRCAGFKYIAPYTGSSIGQH